MSSPGFTFLNATGAPGLSQSDARRMRAHITKTNFANRRRRMAEAGAGGGGRPKRAELARAGQPARQAAADAPALADLLLATPPQDPCRYAPFLSRLWSLVFLDGGDYPVSPGEEAFLQLLASDAALAEVSIAIGIRHWSSGASWQEKAAAHSSRAANIVIQRIRSGTAHTGAVIGAVLTMAFAERLRHNGLAWSIHIDGLANLITERRSQGECDLPPVLTDFLILDSTNDVFGFPLAYRREVIDAVRAYGGQHPVCKVANLSDALVRLRESIDTYRASSPGSDARAREIQAGWDSVLFRARALRLAEDSAYVQATSRAVELVLRLSWRPRREEEDLTPLAGELKEAICRLPVRPCLLMDLTSCQLMLGAVAASGDSRVRAWFVARLRRAVRTLRSRGWTRPLEVLEKGFVSNVGLVARFRALWKELDN